MLKKNYYMLIQKILKKKGNIVFCSLIMIHVLSLGPTHNLILSLNSFINLFYIYLDSIYIYNRLILILMKF